jgi:hypothetical protein
VCVLGVVLAVDCATSGPGKDTAPKPDSKSADKGAEKDKAPKPDVRAKEKDADDEAAYTDRTPVERQCLKDSRIFCIDTNGTALLDEVDPRVGPHDSLTIVVVGNRDDVLGRTLRIETATGSLPSWHYFERPDGGAGPANPAGPAAPAPDGGQAAADGGAPADGAAKPAAGRASADASPRDRLLDLHINDIPDIPSLTITYRKMVGREFGNGVEVERPLNFAIGRQGFYLEPGLVFPTIFNGERTIVVRSQPSGAFSTLHAHRADLGALENVSLGFNFYPWGYPGTKCPAYDSKSFASRWRAAVPFVCHPRLFLRPITIQIGTSITHDAFRQYFVGLGYTPIRGIAFTWGWAFVRNEFFGPTVFEGQMVPSDYQLPESAIERKLAIHPYFGVSLSADILQLGLDFLNLTKKLGHPTDEPKK